ncbi:hypothetical protein IMC75_03050 [Campylobacter peloridis]|uniref:Lipoprotein n=1 Tax=Campylobacter peloridis TaxID=488546 RepID=A0ABX6TTW4_9BACT|nr:hypothetical protein [Campylobacter peloridis]AJC85444.1 hypothetical lipoprotein [Campylobacter peloridis LMG 23910]QOQ89450.1 hypothetical protein IMC75_03050 [Campylobacter peloridis]
MRKLYKLAFLCFLCLFLSSCALKNKMQSQSAFVVLKTPQFKFSDYGFLYQGKNITQLELYNASRVLFKLQITDKICINGICYAKTLFNQKFFNYEHYDDFLQDVISKKPIYQGKNEIQNSCGFSQKLKTKNYDIYYEVCGNNINFNDKKSKIKFSIKLVDN